MSYRLIKTSMYACRHYSYLHHRLTIQSSHYQQNIKDAGNALYSKKEFAKAATKYTSGISTAGSQAILGDTACVDLTRTMLANRAACYLELGQRSSCQENFRLKCFLSGLYHQAADDCLQILEKYPPTDTTSSNMMQKVYVRLARSYYRLGRYEEALSHLDQGQMSGPAADEVRTLIAQAQSRQKGKDGASALTKEFTYQVKVVGPGDSEEGGLQHPPMEFTEQAPLELCVRNPPEIQGKAFLAKLTAKHHDSIMRMKQWVCWNCPKVAVSFLHNPMSWLNLDPPFVIDFSLPICENRGTCDREGREFIQEEMESIQRYHDLRRRLSSGQ